MNASSLRAAAHAIECLNRAESWCVDSTIAPDDVSVSWRLGSACAGHSELREVVSEIVGERIEEFRAEAIRRLRERAEHALRDAGVGGSECGPISQEDWEATFTKGRRRSRTCPTCGHDLSATAQARS